MSIVETPRLENHSAPEHLVRASKALLEATVPALRGDSRLVGLARHVYRRYPEHQQQLDQAASVLQVDPVDLTLGTLSYDALMGLYGCSTLTLATDDGPMVARNMDWSPEDLIARASCIVPTSHGLNAGFVGAAGVVTGLSQRGFGIVLNAVGCERLDPEGYPVLLFLRHLLDSASDFDDAVRLASSERLMASALITLAGTRNDQRVVVEREPHHAAVREAHGLAPLLTTNHYRALHSGGAGCDRYQALSTWTARWSGEPSLESLLGLLTREPVFNGITAQHIVFHPAGGWLRMWVPAYLLGRRAHTGTGTGWLAELLG